MLSNPFIQGMIGVLMGIGCIVAGAMLKIPDLSQPGQTLIGIGLGYMGHAAVVTPPPK